jgi:hypothetical protein
MFLLDWWKQYNDIKLDNARKRRELEPVIEPTICESCETLKMQLAIANQSIDKLMGRILEKPEPERTVAPELVSKPPMVSSWRVKQQLLEKEDREKARLMRDAPKPVAPTVDTAEIKEFEAELNNAQAAREAKNAAGA